MTTTAQPGFCSHAVPLGSFCRSCATYTVRVGDRTWKTPRMGEAETIREANFARQSRDGEVTITRDQDRVAVVESFEGSDGTVALVPARRPRWGSRLSTKKVLA